MDRLAIVVLYQWRAYWRRVRGAGSFRKNNIGALVLIGGICLVRYAQQLPLIAKQLANGETSKYESFLVVVFLAWMLPVMAESRRSISTRSLLHFPLSIADLYLIRLASVFVSPVSWMVAAASLALIYPLSRSASLIHGVVALLLFVLLALFTGLMSAHLLGNPVVRKILFILMIAACATIGLLLFFKGNTSFQQVGYLKLWLPTKLAASAALGSRPLTSLTALAGMLAVVIVISFLAFMPSVESLPSRRSQSFSLLSLIEFPGRLGGLIKKDLRYSFRLLDSYFALPVVILFDIYLVSNDAPSAFAFWIIAGVLILPCIGLTFNSFGLDSPLGLDRYTLLPLSGRETLLSKNLSFVFLVLLLFGFVLPFAVWKLGLIATVVGMMVFFLVVIAYVCCGNYMSIDSPFKMHFYRFASGGPLVDTVMGVIFGSLPGAIAIYFLYHESYGALWKIMVLLLLYCVVYVFSIRWAGRRFERRREAIRTALS